MRFLKLNDEEEDVSVVAVFGVVDEERKGEKGEFTLESREIDVGFRVELFGVKENEGRERFRGRDREDALEKGVVEVDDAGG